MNRRCSNKMCSGRGMGEDHCQGSDSDEDMHHCTKCGDLWWIEKGLICSSCNEFFCNFCWQPTFIELDCEQIESEFDEFICRPCFDTHTYLHCHNPACPCSQK